MRSTSKVVPKADIYFKLSSKIGRWVVELLLLVLCDACQTVIYLSLSWVQLFTHHQKGFMCHFNLVLPEANRNTGQFQS